MAYWEMQEKTGTLVADSAGTVSGTMQNGVTGGAMALLADPADSSLEYTLGSGHVTFGNNYNFINTEPFSIEFWMRPRTITTNFQRLVNKDWFTANNNRGGWNLSITSNAGGDKIRFVRHRNGNPNILNSAASAAINTTYHVVGTYDGATMRLYVNGVLEGSLASTINIPNTDVYALMTGRRPDVAQEFFDGFMNHTAFYSRALTPTEVADHHTLGTTAPSAKTVVTVTRDVSWNVQAQLTTTRDATWSVRANLITGRSLSWAVRQTVSTDRFLLWDVAGASSELLVSRALSWNIRSLMTTDRALSWHVRQSLGATRNLSWDIRDTFGISRQLIWNVDGVLATITIVRDLSWNVAALLTVNRDILWDNRQVVNIGRTLSWTVRTVIATERDIAWAVQNIAGADRILAWHIVGQTQVDRDVLWTVEALYVAPIPGRITLTATPLTTMVLSERLLTTMELDQRLVARMKLEEA
jgi:hypothetical protein